MIARRTGFRWWFLLCCAACGDDGDARETPVSESVMDPSVSALRARAARSFEALQEPVIPESPTFELGRQLFFDERLSADGQVSCSTCHLLQFGGADGLALPLGVAGRKSSRNAATVFNAGLQSAQHWRGEHDSLEEQAARALIEPTWFGYSEESEALDSVRGAGYERAFEQAFPDARAALSLQNFGAAIAAFEQTLITPGRFDAFLGGDDAALDARELAGLELFLDTGCVDCHEGPGLGGQMFAAFGLTKPYQALTGSKTVDEGRYALTQREEDRFVFKVPSLRNVGETAPYFHDGQVIGLEHAVRVMLDAQLGVQLQDYEVDNLVAFLRGLSGAAPAWYTEP